MHTRTMAVAAAAALATTGGTASADAGTQPRTIATAGRATRPCRGRRGREPWTRPTGRR